MKAGLAWEGFANYLAPRYVGVAVRTIGGERRNARAGESEFAGALAASVVCCVREALSRAYGWTSIEVAVTVDPSRWRIVISGRVGMRAIGQLLFEGLRTLIPSCWGIYPAVSVTREAGRGWAELVSPVTCVWARRCEAGGPNRLATELLVSDGPVEVLQRVGGDRLIRGIDGTVGWIHDPVKDSGLPFEGPNKWNGTGDLQESIRSYLGVPYREGGTTRSGLDCSGLVQRIYRETLGILLPRHSADQLSFRLRAVSREPRSSGDLVFLRTDEGSLGSHVGLALRGADGSIGVVHASSTRGCVVEVPLVEFLTAGANTTVVSLRQGGRHVESAPHTAAAQRAAAVGGARTELVDATR